MFAFGMATSVSNENDLGEFAMWGIAGLVSAPATAFAAVFFHTDARMYNESGSQLKQYK